MHKSGTTLLSKTLHESGFRMGDFELNIDYYLNGFMHNESNLFSSKYEDIDFHRIICSMLDCNNLHSLDTIPPFNEETIKKYRTSLLNLINIREKDYKSWGFKNPRFVFCYTSIHKYLNDHRLIIVYRDLKHVLKHYSVYNYKWLIKAAKTWALYNEEILKVVDNCKKKSYIIIDYERYIKTPNQRKILSKFIHSELQNCIDLNIKRKIKAVKNNSHA